jgi:hypothetical protein
MQYLFLNQLLVPGMRRAVLQADVSGVRQKILLQVVSLLRGEFGG